MDKQMDRMDRPGKDNIIESGPSSSDQKSNESNESKLSLRNDATLKLLHTTNLIINDLDTRLSEYTLDNGMVQGADNRVIQPADNREIQPATVENISISEIEKCSRLIADNIHVINLRLRSIIEHLDI